MVNAVLTEVDLSTEGSHIGQRMQLLLAGELYLDLLSGVTVQPDDDVVISMPHPFLSGEAVLNGEPIGTWQAIGAMPLRVQVILDGATESSEQNLLTFEIRDKFPLVHGNGYGLDETGGR